jgi:tetratricopeptide (TPR) repeat protein
MLLRRTLGLGLVLSSLATGGCTGPIATGRAPVMVRSFHGTLVPGTYVSPSAYHHYLVAQLLVNQGRAEEAIDELRHALASDGASAYLRLRLGEELLAVGRTDEAREEVEAALHLDPHFPEARIVLARIRVKQGEPASAEASLKRAVEIDRTNEEAVLALANFYRERGQLGRIEPLWRDLASATKGGSAIAEEALGRLAFGRGDTLRAEQHLKRAVEIDPTRDGARQQLALVYQAEARFGEALAQLEVEWDRLRDPRIAEAIVRVAIAAGRVGEARAFVDRIDDENSPPERRLQVAQLRLAARQPEVALTVAEALVAATDAAAARIVAADALAQLGRAEEAIAQLRKVAPSAREAAFAQARLGRLLRDTGRFREALEALGRALAQTASTPADESGETLYDVVARVHEDAGDRAGAIAQLEAAVAERPRASDIQIALARAYQRDNQWDKAVDMTTRVLKREPDHVGALLALGGLFAERGVRLDEARRHLERALSLVPGDGAIVDALGTLCLKQGKLDEAERLLMRADRLRPDDPAIQEHLGQLYVRRSDRTRALEAYRRALARHPDPRTQKSLEQQILLLETGRVGSR